MNNIEKKLADLQIQISELTSAQRKRAAGSRSTQLPAPPFPEYRLNDPVKILMKELQSLVDRDVSILSEAATAAQATHISEEASKNSESDEEEKTPAPASAHTAYTEEYINSFDFETLDDYPIDKIKQSEAFRKLSPAKRVLYLLLTKEMEFMTENIATLGYTVASINKTKKALEDLERGHVQDAISTLKSAREGDTQNRTLSFLLSQALFYRARNGHAESLPKARQEAKRSCVYTEKFDENKITFYRYAHVTAEAQIDPERAISLMREYHLLSPDGMVGNEGFKLHRGLHFKTWVLLSMLPQELWELYEYESLKQVTEHATGGVLLYLNFFRSKILEDVTHRAKEYLDPLFDSEQRIALCRQRYTDILEPLFDFGPSGLQANSPKEPWTLYERYLRLFMSTATIPSWDETLLYVALDGRRYDMKSYPSKEAKSSGLSSCNYWGTWANSITPFEDSYTAGLIPGQKVKEESAILKSFEKLLLELEMYEENIIPKNERDHIYTFLPAYAYDSFIQLGNNPPISFRAPKEAYYLGYYRSWCSNPVPAQFASEVARAQAQKGGFTCIEEVLAFFRGTCQIMKDPVHGIKNRVKEAQRKIGRIDEDDEEQKEPSEHFKNFWWLYILVLPAAIITFIVVLASGSTGAAMRILLIIFGGLAAAAFILLKVTRADQKSDTDPTDDETIEEDELK